LADVAHFYLTHDSAHEVAGFTVDGQFMRENRHLGLPVVPFETVATQFPADRFKMLLPLSYRGVNRLRAEKYAAAKAKGFELISYVSSRALVWPGLKVGDNCMILENNVIQPFAEIGDDVILWSGTHIGHHTSIRDHCFVAPQVAISGSVTVQPKCFLGVNVTVRDGITIATECVIGAGALILKDTHERGVYVGSPARLLPVRSDELKEI
jgi:sugar O-acyltransferase (sialic acid O-acetyltransferase NeuD family)